MTEKSGQYAADDLIRRVETRCPAAAHALGMRVISLSCPNGGPLARQADIAICAPGCDTPQIQGWPNQLYHCLCDRLEAAAFGEESRP